MSAGVHERALVDTNILIYAHDPTDVEKHRRALALVQSLSTEARLVFSAQVLAEFSARMLRRDRPPRMAAEAVLDVIRDLAAISEVVPVTSTAIQRALAVVSFRGLAFWDAVIWATAYENDIRLILTEDIPGEAEISGDRYLNPLR
jgi:predicted nucleic acid-binding protein